MRIEDITPGAVVKNEEYWIYYVLRDMLKVFGRFVLLDTGSTDRTKYLARKTAKMFNADLRIQACEYGDDADAIGNGPNLLRQWCPTEWLFLLGGDEIWREDQLRKLVELEVPDEKLVVMTAGRNLTIQDGSLVERDGFSADRLFRPSVKWTKTDYPFEGHGLQDKVEAGQLIYTDAYFWHVRHLVRSSRDDDAFFRDRKRQYYPWDGPLKEIPEDWLGELGPFTNPYVGS